MTTAIQHELPAAIWVLDAKHSTAGFAIKYLVSTFRAGFDGLDANLDTTGDQPRLTGSVDPASISVKDENLHAHLQSQEFFDAQHHPRVAFESSAWRRDGGHLAVDGNLTIKGDTRPVQAQGTFTAPHEDPWGNTRLGITLEAVVDRAHFGLTWNTPLPKGGLALANDVRLHVDLQLIKA